MQHSVTQHKRRRSVVLALFAVLGTAGCGSSDISSFLVNPNSPDDTITGEPGTPGGEGVLVADDAEVGTVALDLVNQLPSSIGSNTSVSLAEGVELVYPNGANANVAIRILFDPPVTIRGSDISATILSPGDIGCDDEVPTTCPIPAGTVLIPTNANVPSGDYELTYNFQSVVPTERTVVRRFLTVR